jgi:hypothetical protein
MSSLNRLRKRNNATNYSDNIYNQYIEDYQLYFDNALNKTDYIDYYDKAIIGKCIILDVSFNNKDEDDEKYITTLPNSKLFVGQILSLKFQEDIQYWLITEKEHLAIPSHDKYKCRPCNYILKFMSQGVLYQIPSIVTNQTKYTLGISSKENVGIVEEDSRYSVITSYNTTSKKIVSGHRFIINDQGWKTTQRDHTTSPDILNMLLGQTAINMEIDDVANSIAGAWENKHTYTWNLPTSASEITQNSDYTLNYSIVDETGKDIDYSLLTVKSSDNNLVNVIKNGKDITIKGLNIGTGTITLDLPVGETVEEKIINFEVKSVVVPKTEYQVVTPTNGTVLKLASSSTFEFKKFNGGVQDTTLSISYAGDSTFNSLLLAKKISITQKTASSYTIKNVSISTNMSFVITFSDSMTNQPVSTVTITLKGA